MRILQIYRELAERMLGDLKDWRELSIIIPPSRIEMINPEILAILMAEKAWRRYGENSIVTINKSRIPLKTIIKLKEKMVNKPAIFKFTAEKALEENIPKVRISFERLKTKGRILGRIIKNYAPEKQEMIKEERFEEVETMKDLSELIIKCLIPPRINDFVKEKLKRTTMKKDKLTTLANTVGIIGGLIFAPQAVAPRSLAIIQEIIGNIKTRRAELYNKIEEAIKEGYKEENLREMVKLRGLDPLVDQIKREGYAIIFNETQRTIYEPLAHYLMWNAAETISRETGSVINFIPDANELINTIWTGKIIRENLLSNRTIRLVYFFREGEINRREEIEKMKEYMKDKLILFDAKLDKILEAFKSDYATEIGKLLKCFAELSDKTNESIAFISRNKVLKKSWEVMEVPIKEKSKMRKLLNKIRKLRLTTI